MPPSPSLDSLLRIDVHILPQLSYVPCNGLISLGSWDGLMLVKTMRWIMRNRFAWWRSIAVNRFVSLLFRAVDSRKDERVLRAALPGFLVQLARVHHTRHKSTLEDVETSAATMWGLVLRSFESEAPTLSKLSVLLFKALLPSALSSLHWARRVHLRHVLQVLAVGLQFQHDPVATCTVIQNKTGTVLALRKSLSYPDFGVQEAALQILLCLASCNFAVSWVIPDAIRRHWHRMSTSPNDCIFRRRVLIWFNRDKLVPTKAVLSVRACNSVTTTPGFSAEFDLR